MAQNLSGGLIRPTVQSKKKIFGDQKTSRIPYFQDPVYSGFKMLISVSMCCLTPLRS